MLMTWKWTLMWMVALPLAWRLAAAPSAAARADSLRYTSRSSVWLGSGVPHVLRKRSASR